LTYITIGFLEVFYDAKEISAFDSTIAPYCYCLPSATFYRKHIASRKVGHEEKKKTLADTCAWEEELKGSRGSRFIRIIRIPVAAL
jgi:hypothetical protein